MKALNQIDSKLQSQLLSRDSDMPIFLPEETLTSRMRKKVKQILEKNNIESTEENINSFLYQYKIKLHAPVLQNLQPYL